jgi:predicted porin
MAYAMHLGQSLSPAAYVGMTVGRAGRVNSSVAGAANTDDTGARFISMIASYNLSKRTMVYAEFARLYNAANAGYYFVSTGNLNASGLSAGKGADPRSLMIGMNHTF